jgi:DHA2 family multidrug resistance protein
MLLMMPIAGQLVSRLDPRALMASGFLMTAGALYFMRSHMSLAIDFRTAALLRTFQTIGLPFIFLPSNTLAYVGIPREKGNQIASMNSFVRNIGGSIGIAVIGSSLTRQIAKHQTYMVAHAVPGNQAFDRMVSGMNQTLSSRSSGPHVQQVYGRISGLIAGQATTLAYIDIISFLSVMIVCLIPFLLIMKRPKKAGQPAPAAH